MDSQGPVVFLVDDDPSVLKALSRVLRGAGFCVLTFSSARRFLDHRERSGSCCLILDLAMPELGGLELQRMLIAAGDELPIIFLTGRADVSATVKAMKQGAADFLTKPVSSDELLTAVRNALERDRAVRLAQRETKEIRRRVASLTPREYEVFEHVIAGQLNKQTAAEIGAAEKTVKVHRARVMDKMKVESVAELVLMAVRAGLLPQQEYRSDLEPAKLG